MEEFIVKALELDSSLARHYLLRYVGSGLKKGENRVDDFTSEQI